MKPRWKHAIKDKANDRDIWDLLERQEGKFVTYEIKRAVLIRRGRQWFYRTEHDNFDWAQLQDNLKPSEAKQIVMALWRLEQ